MVQIKSDKEYSYNGVCGAKVFFSFTGAANKSCKIRLSGWTGESSWNLRFNVRVLGASSGTSGAIARGRRKCITAKMPCTLELWTDNGCPFYVKLCVVECTRSVRSVGETSVCAECKRMQETEDRRQKLSRLDHIIQKRKELEKEANVIKAEMLNYFELY